MDSKRFMTIHQLCLDATPGPWIVRAAEEKNHPIKAIETIDAETRSVSLRGGLVALVHGPRSAIGQERDRTYLADAAFIAEARSAVPELLGEVVRSASMAKIFEAERDQMATVLNKIMAIVSREDKPPRDANDLLLDLSTLMAEFLTEWKKP